MKTRHALRQTAFGLGLFAGLISHAAAQASSLALDGHINLGIVKETGRSAELGRGYNNWLRLIGREQVDAELSTLMTLEMRYKPGTGMAETASLFQGESTVGVASKTFGTLRLGRAMSPFWQQKWRFEPWFDSEFMGSLGSYQSGSYTSDPTAALGYANWARIPGAVFYDSASVGGFALHLASGVSRPAGAAGRTRGGALNYSGSVLAGMLSFERNNRDDEIWFAAGSWTISPFTVMGSYSAVRLATAPGSETSYVLAARCELGAAALRFGIGRTSRLGARPSQGKETIGYIVAMSKRTNLYADLYREKTGATLRGAALGIAHMF
jgi:predicted porin